MAKDKKDKKADTSGKRKWYQLLGDGYKLARTEFPYIPWVLLGTFLGVIGLALLIGFALNSWILWLVAGIILAPMITMIVYTRFVEKAAYHQMEGKPGAAGALIGRIKRGWSYSEEPVRFTRQQDLLYRLIGRPGIVLVTEGPSHRVGKLIDEEMKLAKRVAQNVPVHVIEIGTDEGQTRLPKFRKRLNSFKKTLTPAEVSVIARRYDSQKNKALPIPKGIDPFKMRPNRKAMRG